MNIDAGSRQVLQLVTYQADSGDPFDSAEAEQARIDAFNKQLGLVTGLVGGILLMTPAAPVGGVLLAISGATGLYEVKRGIETGDPARVGWGAVASVPMLGSISRVGRLGQLHHIASDKAIQSGFTGAFQRIFSKARMSLQDPANKLLLLGHAGRHSAAYHKYVLRRLRDATQGLSGEAYRRALQDELNLLRAELLRNPDMVKGVGLP